MGCNASQEAGLKRSHSVKYTLLSKLEPKDFDLTDDFI